MTKCDFCIKWNPNYPETGCPKFMSKDEKEQYCQIAIDRMVEALKR